MATIPDAPDLRHHVNGRSLIPPFPDGFEYINLGMGCFWGAERLFWVRDDVLVTAVGYGQGTQPDPSYAEVCSGATGHCELVRVVYDAAQTETLKTLLELFWQHHDPTQGNRQGNDIGSQYRSMIVTTTEKQHQVAEASREAFIQKLQKASISKRLTTRIETERNFYLAESDHQQYLAKNPLGYCHLHT